MAQKTPLVIGEVVSFPSEQLAETRTINIYLPEGYSINDTIRYQVIYVLDGTFNEDFIHITGLVQFFNLMYNMPPTMVVGIANVDRKRDFTFPTDLKDLNSKYPTTGHSAAFISFLEQELQPFIRQNYKINSTKMLVGQSLGGLLATEILLKKPALFTHYLITSPSLWWDNESLLKQSAPMISKMADEPKWVYIAVGKEGRIMEREAKGIYKRLKKSGKKQMKIEFRRFKKENHATVLHRSIYEALRTLYPYKE